MIKDLIVQALKKVSGSEKVEVSIPENDSFGDYSTNLAMILSKKEGKKLIDISNNLIDKLQKDDSLKEYIEKIEFKSGFINFWLKKDYLVHELKKIDLRKDEYGKQNLGDGKVVVIDYSAPNIAKRFSIGHLRSTIIGQAIYNLYEFLGYKVVGDNHWGDWGTQFGTLLAEIEIKKASVDKLSIDDLEKMYVEFNKKQENDPKLHDKAKDWFKKLENGDSKAREIWKKIVVISIEEFNKVYDLLGVKIDYAYGESFYQDQMPEIIEELKRKKISKLSQGAQIVEFKDMPPAMILKSDKTTTYFTRDLATVKYRIQNWNPDIFVYEVGSDQTLHFRQLFETVRKLGWIKNQELKHVGHGLYRFKEGKMSTRKGKTIKLEEILDLSIKKAKEIIGKSETSRGLKENEINDVSVKVGIGAIKYFDLMHQPASDIIFDWEKIFVLEGNSAPYLQYTCARTNSVLEKSDLKKENDANYKLNDEETAILRALIKFSNYILLAAKLYSPNLLCSYLFSLAQKYNTFYNKHKIIGGDNENFRVLLTKSVGQVLGNGLNLLGIEAPTRM
ncbi:arginine--tRNA ligase [Patescibacteria group bacterium]|nr:arginine--tRNA ligase [Patescibacteria group bacterium]